MGADLARTEPFTTSILDGIDIRDTLRHWYEDNIYVKVLPPSRGKLDCVVMLFDSPADPRDYPWRTTWYAEHEEESTLAFFATDFSKELVGPGIALATYGGAMFFVSAGPDSRYLADPTWISPRRSKSGCWRPLVAIALARTLPCSPRCPRGRVGGKLAQRFRKKWVHLPLGQFSDATIQQLRGWCTCSTAASAELCGEFIRKA